MTRHGPTIFLVVVGYLFGFLVGVAACKGHVSYPKRTDAGIVMTEGNTK